MEPWDATRIKNSSNVTILFGEGVFACRTFDHELFWVGDLIPLKRCLILGLKLSHADPSRLQRRCLSWCCHRKGGFKLSLFAESAESDYHAIMRSIQPKMGCDRLRS